MAGYIGNKAVGLNVTTGDILGDVGVGGDIDVDGTANLDVVDVDGAANFAADVTFANGADIITASAGTSNFRAGVNAGNSIVSGGNYNVVVGDEAGTALTTGDGNVAVGFNALAQEDAHGLNVAIGNSTLYSLNAGANAYNTAVGYSAGTAVRQGISNTLIGANAGDALTDSDLNVAIGYNALTADTLGSKSVAVGDGTLVQQNFTSATASYNIAVGNDAGRSITTGRFNVIMGARSLYNGNSNCDGGTFIGYGSGGNSGGVTGDDNTFVGRNTGTLVTSGQRNTLLGSTAGNAITTGGNLMCLGRDAGVSGSPGGAFTTGSNALTVGDENVAACHIQTDWTVASDQRDKTDFTALDLGLNFVKALAPVTYKWDKRSKYGDKYADDYDLNAQTPDGTHKEDWLDIGFKAQEVQALEEAAGYTTAAKKNLTVSTSSDGKQMGLQYSKFVPILVKAMQEQNALIEALTARITTLEG